MQLVYLYVIYSYYCQVTSSQNDTMTDFVQTSQDNRDLLQKTLERIEKENTELSASILSSVPVPDETETTS